MPEPTFITNRPRLRSPGVYAAAAAIALGTVLVHARSYWRTDSLTVCDATVTTDEGLASLQIPLTRLAAIEAPVTNFTTYKRGPKIWDGPGRSGKCPLRAWMAMDLHQCPRAMFAGFGYWKGDWQSNSRPGPFVVVFAPVWSLGLAALVVFLAFHLRLVRFRISFLLLATTVVAVLSWLLTLRATE